MNLSNKNRLWINKEYFWCISTFQICAEWIQFYITFIIIWRQIITISILMFYILFMFLKDGFIQTAKRQRQKALFVHWGSPGSALRPPGIKLSALTNCAIILINCDISVLFISVKSYLSAYRFHRFFYLQNHYSLYNKVAV